jgi:hypothetical protein
MVRQLYRVYLYVVSIALLIFAAVSLALLLATLLGFTPLRGTFRAAPESNEVIQRLVFATVAWLIAILLGGLHFRLIRQDIAGHPEAASGGVRAFFLNMTEGLAALVAVFTVSGAFSTLAYQDPSGTPDTTAPFSAGIAALLVAVLLEIERRRSSPAAGAPIVFQRLHIFGVPLIILIATAITAWDTAMRTTVAAVLIWANVYNPLDLNACAPIAPEKEVPIVGPCALPDVTFLWLAVLVMGGAIALYALLARADVHSLIRAVIHLGSAAFGLLFVLIGMDRGIELLLRAIMGVPVGWSDVAQPWYAPYDFISPLTFGLLVGAAYALWLRAEGALLPLGAEGTVRTMEAIAAVLFAVPFWWGIGRLLDASFQWLGLVGAAVGPSPEQWAASLALVLVGLAYIPLSLRLLRRGATAGAPRRGYILTLLAGGVVTGAAGLAVTLYTVATAALGVPLTNWQQVARSGVAALLVGLALAGLYGWIAVREHTIEPLFAHHEAAPPTPAQPAAGALDTIEQVLDAYAAQTITRSEAAERIRDLMRGGA